MMDHETSALLTLAAAVDNRIVDQLTVKGWHDAIGHLDFDLARRALALHRAESTDYLQPAHIVACAKRIRRDELIAEQRALEASKLPPGVAPSPANLDAMAKAWDNPEEFARQVAIYDQQLIDAGFEPSPMADGRRMPFVPAAPATHSRGQGVDYSVPVGDRE